VLVGVAVIIALRDILSNIASKYFSDTYVPYKLGHRINIAGYCDRDKPNRYSNPNR